MLKKNLPLEKKDKEENGLIANSSIAHSRGPTDSAPLFQVPRVYKGTDVM